MYLVGDGFRASFKWVVIISTKQEAAHTQSAHVTHFGDWSLITGRGGGLQNGRGGQKVLEPRFFHFVAPPVINDQSIGVLFSAFSKVIRFIRFNRWCNEPSGFSVHFHSGLVLYMCIQACVSCLEV